MSYFADVEGMLGDSATECLLTSKPSPDDIDHLATSLGPSISGRHLHRRTIHEKLDHRLALRSVLADWYVEELHRMKREDALEKLIEIFQERDNNLLAADLARIKCGVHPLVTVNETESKRHAKEKIGDKMWTLIMDSVDRGDIDLRDMKEIAFGLGPRVGGAHLRRRTRSSTALEIVEMEKILSDWYDRDDTSSLSHLSTREARRILIKAFREAHLLPLAKKLEYTAEHLDATEQTFSNPVGNGWGSKIRTFAEEEVLSDIIKHELMKSENYDLDEDLAGAINRDFQESYMTWKQDNEKSRRAQVELEFN